MKKRKISLSLLLIMLFNLVVPIYVDMAPVEAASNTEDNLDYLLQDKVDSRIEATSYKGKWESNSTIGEVNELYRSVITTRFKKLGEGEDIIYFSVESDIKGKDRSFFEKYPQYNKPTASPTYFNIFQYMQISYGDDKYNNLSGYHRLNIDIPKPNTGTSNVLSQTNSYYEIGEGKQKEERYRKGNEAGMLLKYYDEDYKANCSDAEKREIEKIEKSLNTLNGALKEKDRDILIKVPKMVQFDPILRIFEHFKVNVTYQIKKSDGSIETKKVPLIYYVDNKTEINIYSHLMKGDYQEKLDQDMLYKPGVDLYEDKEDFRESKYNIYNKKDYEHNKSNPLNGKTPIETDNKGIAKYLLDYKMDFELRTSDGQHKLVYGNESGVNTTEKTGDYYLADDGYYYVKDNHGGYAIPKDAKDFYIKSAEQGGREYKIIGEPNYWESDKEKIYSLRIDHEKINKTNNDIELMGISENYEKYACINFPIEGNNTEKEKVNLTYNKIKLGSNATIEEYVSNRGEKSTGTNIKEIVPINKEDKISVYRKNRIYDLKDESPEKFYLIEYIKDLEVDRNKTSELILTDRKKPKVDDILVFVNGEFDKPIKINDDNPQIYNKDKVIGHKYIKEEGGKYYYTNGKTKYYIEDGKVKENEVYIYEKREVTPYYIYFDKKDYYTVPKSIIEDGDLEKLDYENYQIKAKDTGSSLDSGVRYIDRLVSWEINSEESYIKIGYRPPSNPKVIIREYYDGRHRKKVGNDELQNCIYQVGSDVKEYVIEETSVTKDKFDEKITEYYDFKLPMYADQDGVKMESIKVYEMKELVKSILGDKYNTLLGKDEPYYYDKLPQYYLRYIETNKYMDYHIYFLNYMPKIKMNGNNKAYEFKEDFDLEMDILNKNFDALAYWKMDIVRPDQIKIDRREGINSDQEDFFSEKPSFTGDIETMDKIDYYLYLIDLYKEKGITIDSKEKNTVEDLLNKKIALISNEEATKIKLDLTNEFDKKLLRGVALNKVLEEGYEINSSHDIYRLCNLRNKIEDLGTIVPVDLDPYEGKNIEKDIRSFNAEIDNINKVIKDFKDKKIKSYDDFYKALEEFAKLEIALRELELKKEKINLAIDKYNSDSIKIDKIGKILDGLYLLEDEEGKEPISKKDIEVLVAYLEEKFDKETWDNSEAKKKLDEANPLELKSPKESFKTKEDLEAYMVAVSSKYDLEENKEQIASYLDIQKGIFDIEKIITPKDKPMGTLDTKIEIPEELVFKDVEDIINKIGKAEGLPNLSSDSEELKGYKKMLVNNDSFLKDTITWKYREVENFEDLQKDRDKRLKLKLKAHLDDKSESLDLDEDGYISCFMFRYGNRDDEKNKDSLLKETLDKKIFTGAIKVTKEDEYDNPLPGAKFYLKNEEDKFYTNIDENSIWTKEAKEAKEFISMEDGSFLVRGLGNEEDKKAINQEEVEVKFKGKGAILYSGKQEREKIENLTSAYFYKDGKKQAIDLETATEPFSMENNSRLYLNHTNKSGEKLKLIWTRRENKVEEESYKFLVKKTIENFDEPDASKNDMKPTIMNDGLGIKYDNKGKVSIYDSNDIFTKEGKKLPKEVTGFNKIEMKKEGKVYVRIERKNDKLTITYPNSLENNIKEFFNEDKMAFRKNIDMSEVNRPGYEDPGLTGDDKINFYKDLQETLLDNLIELIPEDEKEIKEKEDIESIIDLIDTKVSGLDSKDNLIIKLEEIKKELVISDLRLEIACKESKNEDVRELSNKLVKILGAPGKGCLCNKALRFDIYTDEEKITYTLFNNKLRTIYFKKNIIPIELTDNSSYEKKEIFVGSNIKLNKENNEWKLTIDGETQKTYNDVNKIYKISNGEKKEIKEISQLYPGQEFELVFDDESRIRIINIDDELKIIKGKKYILEESSPPLGYKLKKDQDMNVFTNVPSYKKDEGTVTSNDLVIRPGLKNIVNIKVVDGSLLIKVIDDYNKKPVVGATYTILSESEKKIDESKYEWVKPENSEIYELKYKNGDYLKTDDEGKIQVDGLGFGEYALQEKKEGDFYHKTWPKIKFELGESQPEEKMDINTHKKGRIALLNVSDSGELIEDSEFSIKSENPSELNIKDLTNNQFLDKKNPLELKTNDYGLIEIDGLDKDKYQIKQVSVPQEYILDELPLEIELSDQKTSHASLFINRKPELPVTGGPGLTRRLVIASLLIIGGISFLLIYNNKKIRDEKGEVEMK